MTRRWRETDSNPRSPVRRTTLFDTPLSQHARATAAFENARRPVQQLLLPVVDPVRMNAELARQLGDRPVPPTATTHPFAFITALRFFRVRSISCSCAVAGRIGFGGSRRWHRRCAAALPRERRALQ